jgi:hypothetical protein
VYQREYFVPKRSGTLADALLAYGLAEVLRSLLENLPDGEYETYCPVLIKDDGAHYTIRLPEALREEWLTESSISTDLARPLLRIPKPKDETKSKTPKKPKPEKQPLPSGVEPLDYNAIWDGIRKVNALIEAQRQQGKINWQEIEEQRNSLYEEHRHRDVGLLLGDYRMQVEAIHNQATGQWLRTCEAGYQATNLRTLLQLFASPDSNVEAIAKEWGKEVKLEGVKVRLTASQVYNPIAGKGQNKPKANALAMGNEDSFWLLEYLKAVGLFSAAVPRAFTDEEMRKTYVLAPARIELNEHETIFDRFKRTLDGVGVTPIKGDVLTALDYASVYLSYVARGSGTPSLIPYNPQNSVHGFYVASYVLLSQNSFTLINLAFLGLPPWLNHTVQSVEDVVAVQAVVAEQRELIRPLREKFQEEHNLLDLYRDFLAGQQTDAFFAFCVAYGEYVVRKLSDPGNRYTRTFSIESLDEIIRRISVSNVDPTEFISTSSQHKGFHNIAYAIRHSTVIPQRQLAQFKAGKRTEKPLYDVRYGLGNNLRRKANSEGEFMTALAEFLQLYNAETEQEFENTSDKRRNNKDFGRGLYRSAIAITDLDDILGLIRKHGVELVCNMLLAYGYASKKTRQQKERDAQQGRQDGTDGELSDDDTEEE